MGFLLDRTGFKETVDNQRDVVKNERRQRYENRPAGMISKVQLEALYPPEHPYYHQVIGSMEDLTAASVERREGVLPDVLRARATRRWSIAGDFDRAKTKQLVEQYFGPIPPGEPITRRPAPEARLAAVKRIAMEAKIQQPQLYVSYPTPANFAPGDRELDLLGTVLAGGKSSRLYKRLVYEMKIAQSVTAGQQSQLLASSFEISASPMPGHTLDEILAVIDEEIAALQAKPVDARRAGAREEPARVGHRAQPREPARARRAPAVIQLHGRRSRLPHRGPAPLPRRRRRRHPARRAAVPEKGRARRSSRSIRIPTRRSWDGSRNDRARAESDLSRRRCCPRCPSPARRRRPRAATAPRRRRRRAGPGGHAPPAPSRTPPRPRRPPRDAGRPVPAARAAAGRRADVQAAEAEALQAEERPRSAAGRVPRPAARRLQPDDQDRRRREPARPRRAWPI